MKTVNLTIDNRPLTAVEGDILLWVALENDIYIQPLRNQRKKHPSANCRLCLWRSRGV